MKSSKFKVEKSRDVTGKVHPIWRGIGCLMLVLIPILSFIASTLIVNEVSSVRAFLDSVPLMDANVDLMGWVPGLADLVPQLAKSLTSLRSFLNIPPIPYFLGKLAIAVIISVIGFGAYGVVYAFIYRVSAPSRYGPLDAPPQRYKKKRKVKQVKY